MSLWNPSEIKAAILLEGFQLEVAERVVARLTRNRLLLPDSAVDPSVAVASPRAAVPPFGGVAAFSSQAHEDPNELARDMN